MTEFSQLTALEARELLRMGEVSSLELTQAVLDRIVAYDNEIKAYLTVTPEAALEQAAEADQMRASQEEEELPPLLGIPLLGAGTPDEREQMALEFLLRSALAAASEFSYWFVYVMQAGLAVEVLERLDVQDFRMRAALGDALGKLEVGQINPSCHLRATG